MIDAPLCPELSVQEVAELLEDRRAVLIDTNPRPRWASGHLPGAINLDPGRLEESQLPRSKDAMLVFYCSDPSGAASRHAARRALQMGYRHVFTMPAGLRGWIAAGKRAEAGRS